MVLKLPKFSRSVPFNTVYPAISFDEGTIKLAVYSSCLNLKALGAANMEKFNEDGKVRRVDLD